MRRSLNYEDAIRILGGDDTRFTRVFGHASVTAVIAAGGFNFVEAAQELVDLGTALIAQVRARVRGVDRLTRTRRLLAAHAVLVVTAYFDALTESLEPLRTPPDLGLSAAEQVSLLRGDHVEAAWAELTSALADTAAMLPNAVHSHETAIRQLEEVYEALSRTVLAFFSGLRAWDDLGTGTRGDIIRRLSTEVPRGAAEKYEELSRRLAVDCPEFAVWVELREHEATRHEVRAGARALSTMLHDVADGRVPPARRLALTRVYRAALDRPITLSGDPVQGLRLPTLAEGYVPHRFRAAELLPSSEPGRESWWAAAQTRGDVLRFLTAFLALPQACEAPLLVLGQPGSGKSVLTRILAATLADGDYLPVRVELRKFPAEAELQSQIELAVREATGEAVSWPRLVESADGALPVVLLDGFDELLQATGVSQTDFLLRVAAFQEREADLGRPLAVVVTSRIAVAGRAAVPAGATALLLEAFDDEQIGDWLDIWKRLNRDALAARGLSALTPEAALNHRELAEQPLLLLMLALYDADANALQRDAAHLNSTDLYERVLEDFAGREVRKHAEALAGPDFEQALDAELLRLSLVAFAMFNRGVQWVSEDELNRDLAALGLARPEHGGRAGLRMPLTPTQIIVGRFFFIHTSQANSDGRRLESYEFLHATFGEFLVARLVIRVLTDLLSRQSAASLTLPRADDDALAYALLSFEVLAARRPVIAFLTDLLGRLPTQTQAALKALLLRLHAGSLYARAATAYADYEPRPLMLVKRCANWSANLVLLSALATGVVTGTELFPATPDDPGFSWHDEALTWRAQLSFEGWSGLINSLALRRLWVDGKRDVELRPDVGDFSPEPIDLYWTYTVPPEDQAREGSVSWLGHTPPVMLRKANFTAAKSIDVLTHALEPIHRTFPGIANALVRASGGRWVSVTHALLAALAAPFGDEQAAETAYRDLRLVLEALDSIAADEREKNAYTSIASTLLPDSRQTPSCQRATSAAEL